MVLGLVAFSQPNCQDPHQEEDSKLFSSIFCYHKVLIRDRRLMPTRIGGIPVSSSEWWPGRVKFISLQKPSMLWVRYRVPVLRVAVTFQQHTGSWPALHTLWIAPKGRERRGRVVYHWFLLCIVAVLWSHCAMRIAEVLHLGFFFQIIPGEVFFWHVVHSPGEGSTCKMPLFTLPQVFSWKLNCTTYWRNALIC